MRQRSGKRLLATIAVRRANVRLPLEDERLQMPASQSRIQRRMAEAGRRCAARKQKDRNRRVHRRGEKMSGVDALGGVLFLATVALSCGGSPTVPSVAQVGGPWRGT